MIACGQCVCFYDRSEHWTPSKAVCHVPYQARICWKRDGEKSSFQANLLSKLYATPLVWLVEFTGEQPGGRYTMYRWHLEVPIRFNKSIKVTIEDGHASLRSDNLYSVAYWYQLEPHAPFAPLPSVEQRLPKTVWTGGPGQEADMK